jgi:hypothetical protein
VTSCDTSELTLMTEPPAAPALELLAIETGEVVEVVELITNYPFEKKAGGGHLATPASPYDDEWLRLVYASSRFTYGSFCNSVRMFCGIVFACATIAVPACCRI